MGRKSRSKSVEIPPAPSPAPPGGEAAPWVTGLWYLATALTVWSFGFTAVSASDLWWHLASGRWIWGHRALPAADSWSFTAAGRPWLDPEWLADVIFHGWALAFGRPALVYWKWGLLLAAYLTLFHLLRRLTGSEPAGWAGVLIALLLASTFLDIRPHLYTLLGYALVLVLTLPRGRPSWALPAVFLVWANLHGGVIFGLTALGVILGVSLLARGASGEPSWRRAAGLWGACALASMANPYGWDVFTVPLRYAFAPASPFRALLREWQPLFGKVVPPPPFAALEIGLLLAAAGYFVLTEGWRRNRAALCGLALSALTLAMALKSRRFVPLFGMSAALVVAFAVAAWLDRSSSPRTRRAGEAIVACLVLIFAVFRLAPHPLSGKVFPVLTAEYRFPAEACSHLKSQGIKGKIYTYYTWGGYLRLCAGGNVRVNIDGRADTVYDAGTYRRYVKVLNREPGWQEVLDSSGAEYVLWPRERAVVIADLLASGRWRAVYADPVSVLLARAER